MSGKPAPQPQTTICAIAVSAAYRPRPEACKARPTATDDTNRPSGTAPRARVRPTTKRAAVKRESDSHLIIHCKLRLHADPPTRPCQGLPGNVRSRRHSQRHSPGQSDAADLRGRKLMEAHSW